MDDSCVKSGTGGFRGLAPLFLVAVGICAYLNSFGCAFLFDDFRGIVENENIRSLAGCMSNTSRPLVNMTFAVNYMVGGLKVADYHAVNLMIHIMAGLFLFGILRRTLLLVGGRAGFAPAVADIKSALPFASSITWLSACAAALWLAHPLQTESVTYICQRAESMMGLFYLMTVYFFLRGATSSRGNGWFIAAILACSLGMLSKAVMVTAPITILLYDAMFCATSLRRAVAMRWRVHAGLMLTWTILLVLALIPNESSNSSGFDAITPSPLEYLALQPGVILHYLKVAFLLSPSCFDYGWTVDMTRSRILVPAILVCGLLVFTVAAAFRASKMAFCGIWFFLVLAPTSSVIPVTDLAVEHRMYLPLAGLSAAFAFGAYCVIERLGNRATQCAFWGGMVVLIVGLTTLTFSRNAVYSSGVTMWSDVVHKRPVNHRAYVCLATALLDEKRYDEVAGVCAKLLSRLDRLRNIPANKIPESVSGNGESMRLFVDARYYAIAHNCMGISCAKRGLLSEAIGHFREAVRILPGFEKAQRNLTEALAEIARGKGPAGND
jgi:protein O-mannosyl-transferase